MTGAADALAGSSAAMGAADFLDVDFLLIDKNRCLRPHRIQTFLGGVV